MDLKDQALTVAFTDGAKADAAKSAALAKPVDKANDKTISADAAKPAAVQPESAQNFTLPKTVSANAAWPALAARASARSGATVARAERRVEWASLTATPADCRSMRSRQ